MVRNQIVKYYVIMALLTHLINRYLSIVTPLIETPQAHLNFHITAFLTPCVLTTVGLQASRALQLTSKQKANKRTTRI